MRVLVVEDDRRQAGVMRERIESQEYEPERTTTLDNVIDVLMARLRRKIDTDSGVRLLHTVRGVGFMAREERP